MRKLLIAALAVAATLAMASVAVAVNVYQVHKAGTTAKGKGTAAKPIPTGITLGFQVSESDATKRGTVIEKYAIGAEGIVANPKGAPACAFDLLNDPGPVPVEVQGRPGRLGTREERSGSEQRPVALSQLAVQPCARALQHRQGHGYPSGQPEQAPAPGLQLP